MCKYMRHCSGGDCEEASECEHVFDESLLLNSMLKTGDAVERVLYSPGDVIRMRGICGDGVKGLIST